jgi:hypothetical protein
MRQPNAYKVIVSQLRKEVSEKPSFELSLMKIIGLLLEFCDEKQVGPTLKKNVKALLIWLNFFV